jgi:hypothetical protein
MDERKFESVKYVFSEPETRVLGEELAREVQSLMDLKDEKKTTLAEIAARTQTLEKRVRDLTHKINFGYEDRDVEVFVLLETPRPGLKRIVRVDNNATIREESMTVAEMQSSFGFTDQPDDRPEKATDEHPDSPGPEQA